MKLELLIPKLLVIRDALKDVVLMTKSGDKKKCPSCRKDFAISNRAALEALEQVLILLEEIEKCQDQIE